MFVQRTVLPIPSQALRMKGFCDGIKKNLILRKPRSGCLEGRTLPVPSWKLVGMLDSLPFITARSTWMCLEAAVNAIQKRAACPQFPHTGTFQMSSAYSAMARSEENQPMPAMLKRHIRRQPEGSRHSRSIRACASQ